MFPLFLLTSRGSIIRSTLGKCAWVPFSLPVQRKPAWHPSLLTETQNNENVRPSGHMTASGCRSAVALQVWSSVQKVRKIVPWVFIALKPLRSIFYSSIWNKLLKLVFRFLFSKKVPPKESKSQSSRAICRPWSPQWCSQEMTQTNLEDIGSSEISQSRKDKYDTVPPT